MRTTSRFIPLLVGPSKESRFCCSLLLVWLYKPIYRNECKRPTFWHKAAKHSDNSHLARRVRTSAIDSRPNGLTSTLCEQRFVNSEDLNVGKALAFRRIFVYKYSIADLELSLNSKGKIHGRTC